MQQPTNSYFFAAWIKCHFMSEQSLLPAAWVLLLLPMVSCFFRLSRFFINVNFNKDDLPVLKRRHSPSHFLRKETWMFPELCIM